MTRVFLVFLSLTTLFSRPLAQNLDSLKLLFVQSQQSPLEADVAFQLGRAFASINLDSSIVYMDSAVERYLQSQDTMKAAFALQYQRDLLLRNNQTEKAVENALRIASMMPPASRRDMGYLYMEIADLKFRLGQEAQMLSYAGLARDLFISEADTLCWLSVCNLLVEGYLEIGAIDSATYFINEALDLNATQLIPQPKIYEQLVAIKLFQGDTAMAKTALRSGINMLMTFGMSEGLAGFYLDEGELLLHQRQIGEAFERVDSARFFAKRANEPDVLAESYRLESVLWDYQNDYQRAYWAFRRYTEIEDSLSSTNFFDFRDREQKEFFQQRRQIENSRLALLLERSASEVEEQRIWIVLLVLTLFVSLVISVRYLRTLKKSRWAYRQLQESNHKLLTKSKELARAQDEIVKSEKMAFLGRIFAGIGHELNTPLAAVKANLQLIEDAQLHEIRKYQELANDMTPQMVQMVVELVIAAYQSQQKPVSTHRQRQLKKEVRAYFEEKKADQVNEFTDAFVDDLKIYQDLDRFSTVYDHPNAISFLDLVTSISTRTRSIMTATEALRRADKILFSLKTYSFKNLDNEKVKFDLVRNINTILTLHQSKLKDITVYKQFDDEVVVEGYPDELTQVWTNLISNAVYANDYRGNLWIRIRQYPKEVRIEFEDTGGGVPAAVKEKIFEPFETTKPEGQGSGLGLSISKKVIEKHDGIIAVENTPQGALFRITLPRKSD